MIVNEFPPVAESGVQRPLKFIKYLVRDGWTPFVITPKALPKQITDESLVQEIPKSVKVFKTASWGIRAKVETNITEFRSELSKKNNIFTCIAWKIVKLINDVLFPVDKQIGWVPFATFKAIRLIKQHKIRNVYVTGFPFSAFLSGIILKWYFGKDIFWIADYRDAWQLAPLLKSNVMKFRYNIIGMLDKFVLKKADYILFTSPFVMDLYTEKYNWITPKTSVITNGYDEDDFTSVTPQKFDKFTFLYMGKIYVNMRNPVNLLKAIKQYMKEDYQFIHVGTIGKHFLNQIIESGYDFYKFNGYKKHVEAISHSMGADINIMINNNDPDSEGTVPGKLFELLRIGKPILAVGPHQSFIKELLESTKTGVLVENDNVEEIVKGLEKLLNPENKSTLSISDIEEFSRKNLTQKLEAIYLENERRTD
jgi:glycosyltransferase involved in cell wall biosynthesis